MPFSELNDAKNQVFSKSFTYTGVKYGCCFQKFPLNILKRLFFLLVSLCVNYINNIIQFYVQATDRGSVAQWYDSGLLSRTVRVRYSSQASICQVREGVRSSSEGLKSVIIVPRWWHYPVFLEDHFRLPIVFCRSPKSGQIYFTELVQPPYITSIINSVVFPALYTYTVIYNKLCCINLLALISLKSSCDKNLTSESQ